MLQFLLDVLFPKKCVGCSRVGSYLCVNCASFIEEFKAYVCPVCLKHSITGQTHPGCKTAYGIDGLCSGVVYKGVVKKLVFRFKYPPYVHDLRNIIGKIFIEMISQNETFMRLLPQRPIVMPIPLSSPKARKRGYNQAELLGEDLAAEFNLKMYTNLKRITNTKPQFTLNKVSRFKNVKDAFEFKGDKKVLTNATVLLVDDLATSCATLRECAKILKRAGAHEVYGVTFAREI